MFALIFAVMFIFTTTVVLTIAAMAIAQWLLERGQSSSQVNSPTNASLEDEARASGAVS